MQQPSDSVSPFSAFQKGYCRLVKHRNAYSLHMLKYRKTDNHSYLEKWKFHRYIFDNHSYLEKQKIHRTEFSMSFSKKSFVGIPLEPGMGMTLSVGCSSERGKVVEVSPNGHIVFIAFQVIFTPCIRQTHKQRQNPQTPLPNEGGRQAGGNLRKPGKKYCPKYKKIIAISELIH